MRMFRVTTTAGLALGCAALWVGCVSPALAQSTKHRTIVESLDEVVDAKAKRLTKTDRHDYTVTRELLPPIDGDMAAIEDGPGWVTVVEARNLQTGSLPSSGSSSPLLFAMLFAMAVLLGSLLYIWRFGVPRFSSVLENMCQPFGVERVSLSPLLSRVLAPLVTRVSTLNFLPRGRFGSPSEGASQWNEETENASVQMTQLLRKIEGVVVRLKDGSPLRDVLNQELRLIHYRISAATDAARIGQDSSEKSAARFRGLVRELERVRRIADSAAASVIDPTDRLALPKTPSEAYALLGVNPDVSPPVLKKIVDALRVTWHPDHARNEGDRLLREERIKQINIAWDLINSDAR